MLKSIETENVKFAERLLLERFSVADKDIIRDTLEDAIEIDTVIDVSKAIVEIVCGITRKGKVVKPTHTKIMNDKEIVDFYGLKRENDKDIVEYVIIIYEGYLSQYLDNSKTRAIIIE